MDRVARCRRAAHDAVADVSPPPLRQRLLDAIDDGTLTPAVLTIESAVAAEPAVELDDVVALAAGTQLIYDGLQLTRSLAHDEPWVDVETAADVETSAPDRSADAADEAPRRDEPADGSTTEQPADLAIVAADVLVARGFSLLADTAAAATAVETVRSFGRDQTRRRAPDADAAALDAGLERDVLDLAVEAGAAAAGAPPDPAIESVAATLASRSGPSFPPADQWLETVDARPVDGLASDGAGPDRSSTAGDG
ncbi:DUF7114 family protein [Halovivax limisalsi]|uniref:DUF7114 family protein n=1 Tax=Halovivax limisalsi TaxID=1453760 RepID=UPI001FFCEB78|nr:hypothetical protein [Halovivax limisalsi]